MKKTFFAAALVAFAGSATAAPLEAILIAHNQRSGATVSTLIFNGSNSINVPWYIDNGVQPSDATWTWDGATGVLQASGLFWTTTHIGSSPSGGSIISDRVVDLAIDTVNKSTSASDYRCIEGTFLPIVGASGCATVQGVTATIFGGPGVLSTVDYNVGGDPTCVNRTVIDPPEFSTGNPRGLTTRDAGGGCDATDGAFVMWNVVLSEPWDESSEARRLIVGNGETLEGSTNFLTFKVGPETQGRMFRYTPNPGFGGVDSFVYRISDGRSSAEATVRISVPVGVDDSATVKAGDPTELDVLANDGVLVDPVTVEIVSAPATGTAVVTGSPGAQAAVRVVYTAFAGYSGPDSFSYSVTDGVSLGAATVTLDVFVDDDNDGIPDDVDNCLGVFNPDQRDTDGDGFGNRCDADLNNDGVVNFADLASFRQRFATRDPDADFNGDGIVNFQDLAIFTQLFGKRPGPSAVAP